nr:zinc finger, RING/FYVE/PHD-type [Tanacetum cinerariifolium]
MDKEDQAFGLEEEEDMDLDVDEDDFEQVEMLTLPSHCVYWLEVPVIKEDEFIDDSMYRDDFDEDEFIDPLPADCPQCNMLCTLEDVRPLYATPLRIPAADKKTYIRRFPFDKQGFITFKKFEIGRRNFALKKRSDAKKRLAGVVGRKNDLMKRRTELLDKMASVLNRAKALEQRGGSLCRVDALRLRADALGRWANEYLRRAKACEEKAKALMAPTDFEFRNVCVAAGLGKLYVYSVASDIDCRSSCTKTQDLDRMPVETITVANQVQFKLQPVGKTFVCGDHGPVTLPKHMYFLAANMADNQTTSINACYSDFCCTTDSATHINAPLTSTPATPTLAAALDLATPTPPTPSLPWVTSSMYTQTKHFAIELYGRTIRRHH